MFYFMFYSVYYTSDYDILTFLRRSTFPQKIHLSFSKPEIYAASTSLSSLIYYLRFLKSSKEHLETTLGL